MALAASSRAGAKVRFCSPLQSGVLLRRYKRFLADIRLDDGEVVTAHCANPGSMKTCCEVGGRVWLSHSADPKRKLQHTWELAEVNGQLVYVNPARANAVVAEAIKAGKISELGGYGLLRREVRYGENSRIDILLERPGSCHVEVKNVTLDFGDGRAAFPDSVTTRGTKHLRELGELRRRGHRAVMLFCLSRAGGASVEPADSIDPAYGQALRRAAAIGVELLAYSTQISPGGVWLGTRVPVLLP